MYISGIKEIGESSNASHDDSGLAASIRDVNEKHSSVYGWSGCCICRVPKLLREGKENAYTPMVVSIGPYHHMDSRLASMEAFKHECLKSFLAIEQEEDRIDDSVLKVYLKMIKEEESQIRGSYADPIGLLSDKFTTMVLLDSIFVIQFLRGSVSPSGDHGDCKSAIEKNKICTVAYCDRALKLVVAKFFDIPRLDVSARGNCDHLLDLVRNKYVGSFKSLRNEKMELQYMVSPTVTHLHVAGVMFKVAPAHKGILTIPKLITEDLSQSLFKNMIALEQCILLDQYSTGRAVAFRCRSRRELGGVRACILVCDMFNAIDNNASIVPWDYAYSGLSEQLNNHCHRACNRYMATLKSKYFAHPIH
ncbi:hypothetical protein V2J09_013750 [Rumex salicifolius]